MGFFSRFGGLGLGDGKRIRFWEDVWCSDRSVASLYPMLFQLVVSKEAMVLDYIEMRNGGIQWIPMFVRCTHDWELEILLLFFPKSLFIPAPNRSGGQNAMLM